ncbi:hypothetical protein PSEUBRA_002816 [Kalmanozyma brasiliensis GHG001]|uniref:MARVEL domain-containing protein n=1 Tax=Kalmanozyma brasiliensis (strain GHG001) TaxID=1365824 RepID=V5GP35_KALBG|nr:uncharacterized protein PSEUBRA_002816 [Kalmanozyma brasiliensis GHG001]EST07717.1 hypothetical protein PSEUBRA_002816 [Kalmanozyma brasiliensis GHG001]
MPDFMSIKKVWGKLDSGKADQPKPPAAYSQGIGNAPATRPATMNAPDQRVAKVNLFLRAFQTFFALVTLLIAIWMAAFQAKWVGGPSGLTGLLLFLAAASFFASTVFLVVPIICERSGHKKMKGLTSALSEARVGLVSNGAFAFLLIILATTQTISAYISPGCKDPSKDPNAAGKDRTEFVEKLDGWCRTKRAEAAFCWFLWISWGLSLLLFLRQWKLERKNGPRIPPFVHPREDSAFEPIDDLDDDDVYDEMKESARYGDGGDGKYVAPPKAPAQAPQMPAYDRRGANPLADIEARYGMSQTAFSDPFADERKAAPAYSRPSYDNNAYGPPGVPGGYAAAPYNNANQQPYSGRPGPPQLPNLSYGHR